MQASITKDRDRFLSFAFAGSDLLIELDQQATMTFIAGSFKAFTGEVLESALNRPFSDIVAAADETLAARSLEQLCKRKRIGPIQIKFKHGNERVVLRGIQALDDDMLYLAFSRLLAGSFPEAGDVDEETGLLTSASFEKIANRHMASARHSDGRTEMTMVHLAGLTDLAGYPEKMTDLLKHVGGVLRSLSVDGSSAGQLADGRFGFIHEKGEAEGIADDIKDVINEQGYDQIDVGVQSIEIAETVLSETEACKALGHVMRAFAGKVDGQENFASLDDALCQSYDDTARRINEFRRTVESLRFQVHFQPIVKLSDYSISHFEALSRFRGGDSPFEMINFAEEVGITQDFDLAVVRKVLEQIEPRSAQRRIPKIAINLSTRSLDMDSFVNDLLRMLQGSGSLAKWLTFEITESAEIKNLERMAKVIEKFQRLGHEVALDDFGAGAAAFHYIRALKVNYVKVDGAYIQKILTDRRDASIVKAMIEMCHSLEVGTIAEMVETQEQVDVLTNMGVDCAQGYFFAKPGPSLDIPSPITVSEAA